MGQIEDTVRGQVGAAAQRRADFLGGGDSDCRALPGQQGGQQGGLGLGAETTATLWRRGSRGTGGRRRRQVYFCLILLLIVLCGSLSGGDGDGLEGGPVDGGRRARSPGNRGLD